MTWRMSRSRSFQRSALRATSIARLVDEQHALSAELGVDAPCVATAPLGNPGHRLPTVAARGDRDAERARLAVARDDENV